MDKAIRAMVGKDGWWHLQGLIKDEFGRQVEHKVWWEVKSPVGQQLPETVWAIGHVGRGVLFDVISLGESNE
jgi:hypothetical protein